MVHVPAQQAASVLPTSVLKSTKTRGPTRGEAVERSLLIPVPCVVGGRIERPATTRVGALVERAGKELMARDRRPKSLCPWPHVLCRRKPTGRRADLRGPGEHDGAAGRCSRSRSVRVTRRVGSRDVCGASRRAGHTPAGAKRDLFAIKRGGSISRPAHVMRLAQGASANNARTNTFAACRFL